MSDPFVKIRIETSADLRAAKQTEIQLRQQIVAAKAAGTAYGHLEAELRRVGGAIGNMGFFGRAKNELLGLAERVPVLGSLMRSLNGAIGPASMAAAGIGAVAAAATGLAAVFMRGVKHAAEMGDELGDLSARTGAPIKDLVVLRQALDNAGAGAASAGPMINLLQRSLAGVNEDGEPTAKIFDQLHLSIDSLKSQSPVDALKSIATALQGIANPAERTAAAMKMFGRSGGEMLAILLDPQAFATAEKQTGRLGQIMQDNAEKFGRFSDAMNASGNKSMQFFASAAAELAPTLEQIGNALDGVDLSGMGAGAGRLAGGLVQITREAAAAWAKLKPIMEWSPGYQIGAIGQRLLERANNDAALPSLKAGFNPALPGASMPQESIDARQSEQRISSQTSRRQPHRSWQILCALQAKAREMAAGVTLSPPQPSPRRPWRRASMQPESRPANSPTPSPASKAPPRAWSTRSAADSRSSKQRSSPSRATPDRPMATVPILLTIGGSAGTPAAYGIAGGRLTTTAGGNDGLALETGESIDATAIIAPFGRVQLTVGGTRLFVGWLDQAPLQAQGGKEGRSYALTGPQRWLDETTYLQSVVNIEGAIPTLGERNTSRTVLNARVAVAGGGTFEIQKPSLREQVQDLFDVVEQQHPGKVAVATDGLPELTLPEDQRQDGTVLSLLQALLRWVPDARPYWDYTTEPVPTMKFGSAASRTLSASAEQAAGFSPRYDLLCRSVTMRFIINEEESRFQVATETAGPSGDALALGATRDLVETIELRSSEKCGAAELIPTGLADAYNAFVSVLWNEGSFQLPGLNPSHRAADEWQIASPYAGLSSAATPAQSITRDLFAETTTVQIGPPGVLGVAERYDLATANRDRTQAGECPNGAPPPEAEISGGPLEPIAYPETTNVRVFMGFIASLVPTGMSEGDDPVFEFTSLSGSGSFYAKITTDSEGEPTAAAVLKTTGGLGIPNDDNTHAHYPLGTYSVVFGVVTVAGAGSGNLQYLRCPNLFTNPRTYYHRWEREG